MNRGQVAGGGRPGRTGALLVAAVLASCATDGSTDAFDGPHDADAGAAAVTAAELPDLIYWLDEDEEVFESEWELIEDDEEGWLVLVEGDLSLGTPAEALADHQEIAATLEAPTAGAFNQLVMDTRRRRRWKNGTIRYKFDSDLRSSPSRQDEVQLAIDTWNSLSHLTGLRWVEKANLKKRSAGVRFDWVVDGERCHTSTGRYRRRRDINLGEGCFNKGTIIHEMGHVMGAKHEQQRSDRNRHVYVQFRNGTSRMSSNSSRGNRRPRRYNSIGSYDTESVMHYGSITFSREVTRGIRLPTHLNRHVLDVLPVLPATNGGAPSFMRIRGHNRHVRLGQRGIDLDAVEVRDVNGNGLDDLVTEFDGGIVWSQRGASGWRPVAPGGQSVQSRLDRIALGDFTHSGGIDALVVDGRDWTLFSSDGTRRSVTRNTGTRFIGVEDLDGDGVRDVFVIHDDESWSMADGNDVLGPLSPLSIGPMGVRVVKLVRLQGTESAVHAVAFLGDELSHVNLWTAPAEWQRVFTRSGRGPLPSHVSALDDIWFVHVNRFGAPTEPIDIVTWADGRDGSDMPKRAPAWVGDVLGSAATGMEPFVFTGRNDVGIDLKDQVAVGHFAWPGMGSVITLGVLSRSTPARSDILGIGTRYASWSGTRLSDRYPIASDHDLATPYRTTVAPGERVELEAAYMSATSLGPVVVRLRRLGATGRALMSERMPLSGKTGSAHFVFQLHSPGMYEVTFMPDARRVASRDVATWVFTVSGDTCGDGFVDSNEACDDGNANSDTAPDACRTSCRLPRCGDGIIDSDEQCDDGSFNSDTEPGVCRTNCRFAGCGDGVLDEGEECDDGLGNSDTSPNACRTTCELPRCGDGVQDDDEECDNGPDNSDTMRDACRTDCRLPWCGDGVLDTGEQCEPVLQDNCFMCQWVG
jgi:cysteine-rich repeat protein